MNRHQLHPLAAVFAEILGLKIRWFRGGLGDGHMAGLVLAEAGRPGCLVLGTQDDDADVTAMTLTRGEVAELRDALSEWLSDT